MTIAFAAILILTGFVFYGADRTSAASWWGDGYRPPEWVLSHGGTEVYYKIIANGASDRYKAIIYRDGKFVEVENGKTGRFDDPKDGVYVVKAVQGGVQKNKTRSGGKPVLSATVVAHPGETIHVVLDVTKHKISVTSDRGRVNVAASSKKKVQPKPQPVKPAAPSVENPSAPTDAPQEIPAQQPTLESAAPTTADVPVEQTTLFSPVLNKKDCTICEAVTEGDAVFAKIFDSKLP